MKKLIIIVLLLSTMLISCNEQRCGILVRSNMYGVDTIIYNVELLHRGRIDKFEIDSIEYNAIRHSNFNKEYCVNTIKK